MVGEFKFSISSQPIDKELVLPLGKDQEELAHEESDVVYLEYLLLELELGDSAAKLQPDASVRLFVGSVQIHIPTLGEDDDHWTGVFEVDDCIVAQLSILLTWLQVSPLALTLICRHEVNNPDLLLIGFRHDENLRTISEGEHLACLNMGIQ